VYINLFTQCTACPIPCVPTDKLVQKFCKLYIPKKGVLPLKPNQMKFVRPNDNIHGELHYVGTSIMIDMDSLSPIGYTMFVNNEIAVSVEDGKRLVINSSNFQTIDIREIKASIKQAWNRWFPFGERNTTFAVGILWACFMQYIFPWLLDVAKVYCAFQITMGFYKENKGITGKDGRSGFQSLVYWGKWLIAIHLIPIGVELLDQIGASMHDQLKNKPLGY
jgi:hypothetical protein